MLAAQCINFTDTNWPRRVMLCLSSFTLLFTISSEIKIALNTINEWYKHTLCFSKSVTQSSIELVYN